MPGPFTSIAGSIGRTRASPLQRAILSGLLHVTVASGLAWTAISAILARTGGEPAVPLDDAFIHFQFARFFAALEPLRYVAGEPPVPGATSLLWPGLLSVFYAAGLRDVSLVWATWVLGFTALALLAIETHKLAQGLLSAEAALCAGLMVLAFSGYTWFAGSGMEVVPFAWLLARSARRASEWAELAPATAGAVFGDAAFPVAVRARRLELCALAWLTPLMRPEGVIASLLVFVCLLLASRGTSRLWALVPLVGPALSPAINWLCTGSAANTTAHSKWLFFSPYRYGGRVEEQVVQNVQVLLDTLLDGRIWSALFVPTGAQILAFACLPAVVLSGVTSARFFRTACVLVMALGLFIPTTYDSFLWNRLRYLWPFAFAWFIGLSALSDWLAWACARLRPELVATRWLFGGLCLGAFATRLSPAIDDLASSADAIRLQQVSLGRWAKQALPKDAIIGVNDTGAIAYFSERRTFDVVGLTTLGEATHWTSGAGSRFEHYERLPRSALPTHFIVYPEWFAIGGLLGETKTQRTVAGATILGGETMIAAVADYRALGSANLPAVVAAPTIDALDVADLESERAHRYELFYATQADDKVFEDEATGKLDGGRDKRTLERFQLSVAPGGALVARLVTSEPMKLGVRVAGQAIGQYETSGDGWEELTLTLPDAIGLGPQQVELLAPEKKSFSALYYWSLPRRR